MSDSSNDKNNTKSFQELVTLLIQNLYQDEIQKQLELDRYKAALQTPCPLNELLLVSSSSSLLQTANQENNNNNNMKTTTGTTTTTLLSSSFLSYPPPSSTTDITYWTSPLACIAQLHVVLQQALMDVTTRTMTENTNESLSRNNKDDGITTTNNNNNNTTTTFSSSSVSFPSSFDKDHDGAMLFVTAASNLRNLVFSIQPIQSIYSTKGIAGNIIPASTCVFLFFLF